jgi:hypothetical protein
LILLKKYDIIFIQNKDKELINMYICPVCGAQFEEEQVLVKHYLSCWKRNNPHLRSKPAPRSEDINTREISSEMEDFFNSFK